MKTQKTFAQVIAQPTTSEGGYKTGLWLTRMVEAADKIDVVTEGSATINGTEINLGAAIAVALSPAFDNKSNTTIEDLLNIYKDGFAAPVQARVAQAGTTTSKPLASVKSNLTAEEYKTNSIRLGIAGLRPELFEQLFTFTDKSRQSDLWAYVQSLQTAVYPDDKQAVYAEMLAKEEAVAKQFEGLTAAGFNNIQRINDALFSATIPAREAETIQKLDSLGYVLKNHSLSADFKAITVNFSAKQSA